MQKGSVNRVILVGHLGSDPETRYTPAGKATASFSLATNEAWRNNDGELQEHTEWHKCVLFGKQAEMAKEYLKKGQMVYMEGVLRSRTWEDSDGVKKKATDVNCSMFTMLGRKVEGRSGSTEEESTDDDLPF